MNTNDDPTTTAVRLAHEACVRRDNASTTALRVAYHANGGNFPMAVAAAVSCLGGRHAPIAQTMEWVNAGLWAFSDRVPGFGNSFIKGQPDPVWDFTEAIVAHGESRYNDLWIVVENEMKFLHGKGKDLYPNAAAFTAIWALGNKLTPNEAVAQVVAWRLPVWAELANEIDLEYKGG